MTTASSSELVLPLLQRFYSLETIAREPWDQESVLYVPKDRLIFVDGSSGADSIAALIYLNTLNLRFTIRRVNNANQMSPSGIGPLLKCGRFSLGEYEPIVNFCNLKGFRLLSDYLNHSNKSFVKSYILLIQKAFSDTISYFLWKNESTPQKMLKSIFRESYVWPLSDILYYSEYSYAKKRLEAIKLWNCEPKQVLNRFIEVIDSLNRKLEGGNLFLIDKRLTEADLILYSYIKFVKSHTGLTAIAHELYNFKNLSDFYANLNEKYEQLIKDELNI